jgi:hypothetical protein
VPQPLRLKILEKKLLFATITVKIHNTTNRSKYIIGLAKEMMSTLKKKAGV